MVPAKEIVTSGRQCLVKLILSRPRHSLQLEVHVFNSEGVGYFLKLGFLTEILARADLVDGFRNVVVGSHVLDNYKLGVRDTLRPRPKL